MSKVTTTFSANDQGLSTTIRRINGDMDRMKNTSSAATKKVSSGFSAMAIGGAAAGAAFAALNITVKATGAAIRGTFDYVKNATANASDLGETIAKVGEIFGSEQNQISEWASNAAKSLGQSKTAAMNAAADFAIFGKSAGLGGSELVGFSTELANLSSDLASFNNTSPEEAVIAIGAALRGEAEPMRRFGVLLNDASLRNEALKQGLIETTKQALTPQQKVLASYALIMNSTKLAQGDFARTSGGLANQQRILKANMTDLSTEVGQVFLPIVNQLTKAFNEYAIPALKAFSARFSGVDAEGWGKKMVDNVMMVADTLIGAFVSPKDAVKALGNTLLLSVKEYGNRLLNSYITAGKFLKNYFTSDIPLLLVSNMKNALIMAYAGSASFLTSKLSEIIKATPKMVGDAFEAVVKFLSSSFEKVTKFFAGDLKNALLNPIDFISGKLKSELGQANKSGAYEFKEAYNKESGNVLDKLSSGLGSVADLYGNKINNNNKKIGETFKGLAKGTGSDIDFFGAGKTKKDLQGNLQGLKEAGNKWRENLTKSSDESKKVSDKMLTAKLSSDAIKSNFTGASAATGKIKEDLSLSVNLTKELRAAQDKNAVDKGGSLEAKFRSQMESGRTKGAAQTIERIKKAEEEAEIKSVMDPEDRRRSIKDIAKREGIDTFRKTDAELRQAIIQKRRAEGIGGGDGGAQNQGGEAAANQAAKDPQGDILSTIKDMLGLLQKIEPKLPVAALGL